MSETPLKGQVAVITGSARNIGREIALQLAREGAAIVVNGRSDEAAAQSVAREIRSIGGQSTVCMADVTEPEAAANLMTTAKNTFGRLDILVCNAAIRRQQPFVDIPIEEWHEVMNVDLNAPFYCLKAAIPMMIEQKYGRVVTIGGSTLHLLTPNRAHVTAAKMGLLGLTRAIAIEHGEFNITANCVAPGHIETVRGASAGNRSTGGIERPIERLGSMAEVASMVTHLCKPEGAYVTGQCLHVNGGMYMGGA